MSIGGRRRRLTLVRVSPQTCLTRGVSGVVECCREHTGLCPGCRETSGRRRRCHSSEQGGRHGHAQRLGSASRSGSLDHGLLGKVDSEACGDVGEVPHDGLHLVVDLGDEDCGLGEVNDQRKTTAHRGRKGDPLYRVRNVLRAGQENLTERQRARLEAAFTARAEDVELEVASRCAQQVRSAYH